MPMAGTGGSESPFYAFKSKTFLDMGVLCDVDIVIVSNEVMVKYLQVDGKGYGDQKQGDTCGRISLKSSEMVLHGKILWCAKTGGVAAVYKCNE